MDFTACYWKSAFSILTAGFFNSRLCNSTNIYTDHLSIIGSFKGVCEASKQEVVGSVGENLKFEAASFLSWIRRFACLIGAWQPVVTGSITRRLQQSAVGA